LHEQMMEIFILFYQKRQKYYILRKTVLEVIFIIW